jgi:hypothetical protein
MRALATLVLVLGVLGLAACGGDDEETGGTTEATRGVIEVKGAEYAFVMPDQVEGGVVTFETSNIGKEIHEYAFGRLDQGKTIEDVKALLEKGPGEPPAWFTDLGGVPVLSPGEEITLTRDLEPGTYVFLCFIPSPKGVPHVNLGMIKELQVTGDSGRELPEPDAVIAATPATYEIPEIEAGRQTIELRNADKTEREFFILALEEGKTLADVDKWANGGFKGAAPATFHGAMQTIKPGTSVFVELDLEAGVEYTITDTAGRRPITKTFTPS